MRKIQLGYYMYTPMLGGAETYLKDLLWNIDRDLFDITFYYEAWPDFEGFLELDQCPSIRLRPINVIEPGGHTHVDRRKDKDAANISEHHKETQHRPARSRLRSKLRPLYKRIPFGPAIVSHALRWLNYSMWASNKAKLKAALSERPPDVLHVVNGGYPGAATARIAAIVAKELGIPCVMTIASTPSALNFPQSIERRIDKLIFDSVEKFIIIADLPGQALTKYRKFHPSKFQKIYWGVKAPEPITSDHKLVKETKAQLGIPPDALVIGSVASFVALKGQRYLIDAISLLRLKVPNLRAVLVGDGPTLPEVKKRAAVKGVSDIVTFTGQYNNNEVFAVIRSFDLFVHPSELEGLPYVVIEAMSQRKPVVATDVGGTPDAVISGETGLLVAPCDPIALAEAMAKIIGDRRLAEQMSNSGYVRYKENFTIERMVQQHELLYQQLAERQIM